VDRVEEARAGVELVRLPRQGRGKVEAEAVDPHLGHPVAQGVHDQLEHRRVAGIERVAGAGVVQVVAGLVRLQLVVGSVVDAAEGEGRAEVVALGGVVVDDVEDHLEAGGVERLDHRLELADRTARRPVVGEVGRGGEEADRVVAPVVGQPFGGKERLVDPGVDGQQLDGGDAETAQVVERGGVGETGVGAA
jgi:hypothetical protein